jgi:hypothetical protein
LPSVVLSPSILTYWEIGRHIVEFEQGGETRAAYGKRLLGDLADALTRKFGRGFDASHLRYMRLFYQAFPIRDALRSELSWTYYRLLFRVDPAAAHQWYLQESFLDAKAIRLHPRHKTKTRLALASSRPVDTASWVAENRSEPPPVARAAGCFLSPGESHEVVTIVVDS